MQGLKSKTNGQTEVNQLQPEEKHRELKEPKCPLPASLIRKGPWHYFE